MWINWTHEAAFAKSRLTENSVGCVASQHNYIAVQFRYKLGHGSVSSTVGHGGALAVLTPLSPARNARRFPRRVLFCPAIIELCGRIRVK
jgi:hypothetical protein